MEFTRVVLLLYYVCIGFTFQFPAVTMRFYLIETCGITPTQMMALQGVVGLPWTIKVLYGFVSDAFPICGYQRVPYIVLSMVANFFTWIGLSMIRTPHILVVGTLMTISSMTMCVTDVMVDSILVYIAREEKEDQKGTVQSYAWGARFLGGMVAALFGGLAYEHVGHMGVFIIQSCIPLIMLFSSFLLREAPVENVHEGRSRVKKTVQTLWGAIKNPGIYKPALFIFIINCTPEYGGAMTFFYEKQLKFTANNFAMLDIVSYVCALLSTVVYRKYLRGIPFKKIFLFALVSAFLLENTLLLLVTHVNRAMGISDVVFATVERVVLTFVNEFILLPMVVLGARLCPPGVEGSLYAILMSISKMAGVLGSWSGGLITDTLGVTGSNFTNLWLLMVICHFCDACTACFVCLLPGDDAQQDTKEEEEEIELIEEQI